MMKRYMSGSVHLIDANLIYQQPGKYVAWQKEADVLLILLKWSMGRVSSIIQNGFSGALVSLGKGSTELFVMESDLPLWFVYFFVLWSHVSYFTLTEPSWTFEDNHCFPFFIRESYWHEQSSLSASTSLEIRKPLAQPTDRQIGYSRRQIRTFFKEQLLNLCYLVLIGSLINLSLTRSKRGEKTPSMPKWK